MMEIAGKILLVGGFLGSVISQTQITVHAFKIRYYTGLSCLLITPMQGFISSDLRKENKVRVFLKLWGASLLMIISGAYALAVA